METGWPGQISQIFAHRAIIYLSSFFITRVAQFWAQVFLRKMLSKNFDTKCFGSILFLGKMLTQFFWQNFDTKCFWQHFGRFWQKKSSGHRDWKLQQLSMQIRNEKLTASVTVGAIFISLRTRVARFFLLQNTKKGKIYQITTNYAKCQ
jgi:hypothetical protein